MNHVETSIAMFPGREIPVVEWSDGESRPPILMLAGSGAASDWAQLATGLATDYRMLALEQSEWPLLIEAIWASGEPAVLVAQGDAAEAALKVASVAPGSVRAAIVVDYALPHGAARSVKLAMPCLVFRGRQSDTTTHGDAVALHEAIPGSHLIEPENCSAWPDIDSALALEESIRLFLSRLGAPFIEFETADQA